MAQLAPTRFEGGQCDPDFPQTVKNDVHAMQCILFMFC